MEALDATACELRPIVVAEGAAIEGDAVGVVPIVGGERVLDLEFVPSSAWAGGLLLQVAPDGAVEVGDVATDVEAAAECVREAVRAVGTPSWTHDDPDDLLAFVREVGNRCGIG